MENEKTNTETKTEEVHKEDSNEAKPLEEAKEVLSKLEEQNKVMTANLARAEELAATNLVSGGSLAGQVPKKESHEDKIEREAKAIIASAGMEL